MRHVPRLCLLRLRGEVRDALSQCAHSGVFCAVMLKALLASPSSTPKLLEDVEAIAKHLHITQLSDWYHVPKAHIKLVPGTHSLLKQYPTVESLLRAAYPTHAWDSETFTKYGKRGTPQTYLQRIVRTLFPGMEIGTNVRGRHGMKGERGAPLEIDIFLPSLNLGFEYQDPHHYFDKHYGSYTLSEYQDRDKRKQVQAVRKGITIVNIPFWWDWNIDSLIASIQKLRPDLLKDNLTHANPIDTSLPQEIIDDYTYYIPGLGLPMLALYSPQSKNFDPSGWLIFEKYDGARAIWNRDTGSFFSRWGTPFDIPNYIIFTMPPHMWLDGEIWFGRERGMRYLATKIATAAMSSVNWNKLQYMVFDCPNPNLLSEQYENRYQFLSSNIPPDHPFIHLAPYVVCRTRADVETEFFKIRAQKGEGIILRHPFAKYICGYSRFLYKHKGFNDAEAMVIAKKSDHIYLCRIHKEHLWHNETQELTEHADLENSENFLDLEIPLDEAFDGDVADIKDGKFVSFRYIADRGTPKNPRIYTIRDDIKNWMQIMHSKRKPPVERVWKPQVLTNDWTQQESHRKFMESFARENGFDPLIPENWYSVERSDIVKEAPGLLQYYEDSFVEAVIAIFPEVTFQIHKFKQAPKNYWDNKDNRRKFFVDFAKSKGIDPLIPSHWYSLTIEDFRVPKMKSVVVYYKSIPAALMDLFPFVGLEVNKFALATKGTWSERGNRRKFFDEFALAHKFDPLEADNWYRITAADVQQAKKGHAALSHFGGSFVNTIVDAYPDIGLKKSHFHFVERNFWANSANRRSFFDEFAKKYKFDPLNPENWYLKSFRDFEQEKKVGGLISGFYRGSVITALLDVYPDIGLDAHKFKTAPRNQWANIQTHKKFFSDLASDKGFDPLLPQNWYSLTGDEIAARKGARNITVYHAGSLAKALCESYPDVKFDTQKLNM
eukprot:Phypoly_transcript_00782.p1 GENE.Phypoly_transcript_00782~~Phypoly_transcript_00782.p1  ORF type:complete len:944 (+),score=105.33 Phypoly_transcript_00782:1215-4046(+)